MLWWLSAISGGLSRAFLRCLDAPGQQSVLAKKIQNLVYGTKIVHFDPCLHDPCGTTLHLTNRDGIKFVSNYHYLTYNID